MSYAHHWEWETPIADPEKFALWSRDVYTLLENYPSYPNHWYGEHTPHSLPENWEKKNIYGPQGIGEPVITNTEVAFNGDDTVFNSHNTFSITLKELLEPEGFGGCGTSCKPYDLMVTAALIRLKHYFPEIHISGDGEARGFQQGAQFCRDVFGIGVNPEPGQNPEPEAFRTMGVSFYPSLQYLKYVMTWYQHLHPLDTIRYATLTEKIRIESSVHSEKSSFFDIVNDSESVVWDVITGGSFPPRDLEYGYFLVKEGTTFPASDYLAYKAIHLTKQHNANLLPYKPGTPDIDQQLKKQASLDEVYTAYFNDGTIMYVKIPSKIEQSDGISVKAQGIMTYSIAQTTISHEDIPQVDWSGRVSREISENSTIRNT